MTAFTTWKTERFKWRKKKIKQALFSPETILAEDKEHPFKVFIKNYCHRVYTTKV